MKRFSDTNRFDDPWFQSLSPEMKMAWEYVWAKCDNAGVWNMNTALADFQIGNKVDWIAFILASDGRLLQIEKSKLAIVGFVAFQCGKLNPDCRPHSAVISLLKSHGLLSPDSLSIEYSKGINTLQYKDKEKDQDKEKDADAKSEKAPDLETFCEYFSPKIPDLGFPVPIDDWLMETHGYYASQVWPDKPPQKWRAMEGKLIANYRARHAIIQEKTVPMRNGKPQKPINDF